MHVLCLYHQDRVRQHVGAPFTNILMHATDTFVQLGQIPGLDIEVKLIPMIIAVMLAAYLAHSNLAVIVSGGVGKNGSTVAVSVGLFFQFGVSVIRLQCRLFCSPLGCKSLAKKYCLVNISSFSKIMLGCVA